MAFELPLWSPGKAEAILLDWDGVIADTKLDFSAVRAKYYGNSKAMLLEDADRLPTELQKELMRDLEELEVAGARNAVIIDGIERVLSWIAENDIPWAVVSRNSRRSITIAAQTIGVKLPPIVRSRDDGTSVKPDPRALTETCDELEVDPAQTLFVGDFIYDMIGARRAGMRGILVRAEIRAEWYDWLEYACLNMNDFADTLTNNTKLTPWENLRALKTYGMDFLKKAASLNVCIDKLDKSGTDSRILQAAALGVGSFCLRDGSIFEPDMWRNNPAFPAASIGLPDDRAVKLLLDYRFPLVKVTTAETSGRRIALQEDMASLVGTIRETI